MKIGIMFVIILALLGKQIHDYLSLPIAGINLAGNCKYLIIEGKKYQPCPFTPIKYVKERVDGWE